MLYFFPVDFLSTVFFLSVFNYYSIDESTETTVGGKTVGSNIGSYLKSKTDSIVDFWSSEVKQRNQYGVALTTTLSPGLVGLAT